MPRLHLTDEQIARLGYIAGGLLVAVAVGLALRSLDEPFGSPLESDVWSALSLGRAFATVAALIIVTSSILGPRHRKSRIVWPVAAVSLVLLGVLMIRAAVDEDMWSLLDVLVGAPFPLLLLLPYRQASLPLGGPARWGVYLGCFIAVVAVVGGIKDASDPSPLFSSGWAFLQYVAFPLGLGLLLLIISLPQEVSLRSRRTMALVLANCVLLAGLALSVHLADVFRFYEEWFFVSGFSAWISLALLIVAAVGFLRTEIAVIASMAIVVAGLAISIRFATVGDGFDEWNFVYGLYVRLAYALLILLCAVITDRGRKEETVGQPSEPVWAL